MTTLYTPSDLRSIGLGAQVTRSHTLTNATTALFTVTGIVAVTAIAGLVTTAVTVANTYKLQHHPAAGTTKDLCASADIGTTDTALGEIFVLTGLATDALVLGAKAPKQGPYILTAGSIEGVSGGTDGVIAWSVTWVPWTDGATLVAA